jgi:hypothetical protein
MDSPLDLNIWKAGAGRVPPYHPRRPDVDYPETVVPIIVTEREADSTKVTVRFFLLTNKPEQFRICDMKQLQVAEVMSWMGKRSYATRLQRFGIERIRDIARENGKKGGRPRKEQKTTKL